MYTLRHCMSRHYTSRHTLMTQIKTYNVGMCTHAHPMLRNTSKEHKSSTCAPPNSKWPPKPQSSSKALQNSSKAPKAPPTVHTCTSNTHKPSRSFSMHTSNQTSNHATRMSGPITYQDQRRDCVVSEQSQAHRTHKYVNNAWSEIFNSPPTLLFIPFHVPRH